MRRSVRQELRKLPYRDMRELSEEITDKLPEPPPSEDIAMALTCLNIGGTEDDMEQRRRLLLSEFFCRKKQITIQPEGKGFKICVPTTGLTVHTEDIEEGLHDMTQTLISFLAME